MIYEDEYIYTLNKSRTEDLWFAVAKFQQMYGTDSHAPTHAVTGVGHTREEALKNAAGQIKALRANISEYTRQ